jgi:phage gp45-like
MAGLIDTIRSEISRVVDRLASSIVRRGMIGTSPSSSAFMQVTGDDSSETFESVESWQHFGFTSRPPAGGEVALLCPGGEGCGAVAVAEQDRAHRPSLAASGDVAVYGKKGTGQPIILLDANEKILVTGGGAHPATVEITSAGKITVTCGGTTPGKLELATTGAVKATSGGTSGSVEVTEDGEVIGTGGAGGEIRINDVGDVTLSTAAGGTLTLNADGSIQVTPASGKTVQIGGTTDAQLLGSYVVMCMQAFFTALLPVAYLPGPNTAVGVAATTALATLAGWSSSKARVG